jgi:hypothetical protein
MNHHRAVPGSFRDLVPHSLRFVQTYSKQKPLASTWFPKYCIFDESRRLKQFRYQISEDGQIFDTAPSVSLRPPSNHELGPSDPCPL